MLFADRRYDHDKYRPFLRQRGIRPVIAERGQPHGICASSISAGSGRGLDPGGHCRLSATTPTMLREPVLRDTRPVEWFEQAQAAEQRRDWDAAIALVSAHAECYSADPSRHDSHLWHMDLLARAERLSELTERALTDVHARRRLNASLHERGMEAVLRNRAEDGDHGAL